MIAPVASRLHRWHHRGAARSTRVQDSMVASHNPASCDRLHAGRCRGSVGVMEPRPPRGRRQAPAVPAGPACLQAWVGSPRCWTLHSLRPLRPLELAFRGSGQIDWKQSDNEACRRGGQSHGRAEALSAPDCQHDARRIACCQRGKPIQNGGATEKERFSVGAFCFHAVARASRKCMQVLARARDGVPGAPLAHEARGGYTLGSVAHDRT